MKVKKLEWYSLLFAILFTGGVFTSCGEDEQKNNDGLACSVIKYTKCKEESFASFAEEQEKMEYVLNGDDLIVTCYNLAYNCCDSVLKIMTKVEDNKIIIKELGDHICDCICRRDAQFQITNIPQGHYEVIFEGRGEIFQIDIK